MRRFRCFVFDNPKSVRSSYSVKTKAYSYAFMYINVMLLIKHLELSVEVNCCKINVLFLEMACNVKIYFHITRHLILINQFLGGY